MNARDEYLMLHKTQRERRRQVIVMLTVFSVMVAVIVFWWLKLTGVTVTGEAFCSFTEHTHNSSCYEYTLICTDESEEHEHTADCMEQTFICEKDEHVHTSACYSNPEADKETAADWESSFEKSELTASAKNNILYIASTQVGYTESTLNYETDENGVQHGYSRYGEWYGNPYGDWSAMFVSFCLNYADVEDSDLLQNSGAEAMRLQWQEAGLYEEAAFHTPEKGELVFLDTDADLSADTVGIVKDYTDGVITAIFGDWENSVSEVALTDVSIILGFGLTKELTVAFEEESEAVIEEENYEETPTEQENEAASEEENAGDEITEDIVDDTTEEDAAPDIQYPEIPDKENEHGNGILFGENTGYDASGIAEGEQEIDGQAEGKLSDSQIIEEGGTVTSSEGDVEISKTIKGTDIENVFDITLTVRTETNVQTYLAEPDMAVVIVMDISNTMTYAYGSTTRYKAAMAAAESFIDEFAAATMGISKLGFVAFNTHAYEILPLQPCTTSNKNAVINEIRAGTEDIIYESGYASSHDRFTNIEGGLKRGYDMLKESGNANQYIIFLSDGFPTTYLKNGTTTYQGYDPYTPSGTKGSNGVFYDYVTGYYCAYGTSYSDKAAIRARQMATQIKNDGAKIFSIGVDVGGQSISGYERTGLSVIDRTGTTYEIGAADSKQAYKNWLQYSIGSGAETVTVQNESGESETLTISYYHDSTDQDSINSAFDNIFTAIGNLNEQNRYTVWATTDPLPVFDEDSSVVEFIHFYKRNGDPSASLDGENEEGAENTADYLADEKTIRWDLKASGFTQTSETTGDGTTTYYYYTVTYRVRLYNENDAFVEYTPYETNGDAYLKYKTIVNNNGVSTISEEKRLDYPKPVVEGYLSELEFNKKNQLGEYLEGAQFTLTHNDELCSECHGNGAPVTSVSVLGPFISDANGKVSFTRIPSGHIYTLTETVVPEGHVLSEKVYIVKIAMDELSVKIYDSEDDARNDTNGTLWDGGVLDVINVCVACILPETGSVGTLPFTICGLCLMAFPILYSVMKRRKERRLNR